MVYRRRIFKSARGRLKPGVLRNARFKKDVLNRPIKGYSNKAKKDSIFLDNNTADIEIFALTLH
jgi:hypothetical protein